jgi:hypothetical protein
MAQITLNSTGVASDGALVLQSNGTTTAVTISTAQVATLAKDAVVQGVTVGRGAGAISTNTAVGASALAANTSGANNIAVGSQAGLSNTTGSQNTAIGRVSLYTNTTGNNNTSLGYESLNRNTTGSDNVAIGYDTMYFNTTGGSNVGIGREALLNNTIASYNTAVGYRAAYSNTTGTLNTFVGNDAGYFVTTGSKNTILGAYSGNGGGLDIRTASNYIVLSDGDGNPRLFIDNSGYVNCIGAYNNTSAAAANATFNASGYFSRSTSALKYKQDIRDLEEMDISLLRPVRYKSKCEGDDQTKDHLGLIADEAAEAGFEELITYGADGEVEGFQYERLTVVLLKAIQSLKAEFDAYKATHP